MGSFLYVSVGAKLWGQKGARKLQWALCLLSRILEVPSTFLSVCPEVCGCWLESFYCSELLLSASSRKPTGTLDYTWLEAIGKKGFIAVRKSWIYTSLKVIEPIGQHLQYINNAQRTKVVSLPIIELGTQVKCYTLLVSPLHNVVT